MLAMHSFGTVVYRSSRASKRGRWKVTRRHEILIPLGNAIQLRPQKYNSGTSSTQVAFCCIIGHSYWRPAVREY